MNDYPYHQDVTDFGKACAAKHPDEFADFIRAKRIREIEMEAEICRETLAEVESRLSAAKAKP